LILFLFSAALALSANGGEPPCQETSRTLEECIRTGISQGFEVRRFKESLSISEEASKLSVLDLLPSAQASGGRNWQLTGKVAGAIDSWLFSAGAGISANALAEGIVQHKGLKSQVIRSRAELQEAVLETALDITQEYLRLLLAMQSCKDADSSLSAIRQLRAKTATEVEVGKSSRGTLAEIEAQVASERAALVKAQGERRSASMALAESMNLPARTAITITPPAEEQIPPVSALPDEAQILSYLEHHPRLTAANAALESALQQRKAALIELFPQLEASVDYVTEGKYFARDGFPLVGVGITIPISDGSLRYRQSRAALSEVRMQKLNIEDTRRKLETEIRSEILEAVSSWESLAAFSENLKAMEISFHICEAKFDAGAISGSDYITSRKNYLSALAQYWQALYSYVFRMRCISIRMNYEILPQTVPF